MPHTVRRRLDGVSAVILIGGHTMFLEREGLYVLLVSFSSWHSLLRLAIPG